jgi:outer membrane protein TolC
MRSFVYPFAAVALAFLSGCGIRPETPASNFDIPCSWQSPLSEGMQELSVNGFVWWEELNDPQLDSLMDRAYCHNLDLHLAYTQILEARFQVRPLYLAAKEGFYEAWNLISADVASSYVSLRLQQQLLEFVNKNIEIQQNVVALTQDLLQRGMSSTIDQKQAEQQLNFFQAKRPQIERLINKSIFHLSVLLASPPHKLMCELTSSISFPTIPMDKPVGVPPQLLCRRCDVRKAEQEMIAVLDIDYRGVSNLFPHLSLEGFLAYATGVSKVKVEQAYYQYQKVVLNALEETENALDEYYLGLENNRALLDAFNADRAAYDSVQELHAKGFKSDFDVLMLQRALLTSEEAYTQSNFELLLQFIALYKALG